MPPDVIDAPSSLSDNEDPPFQLTEFLSEIPGELSDDFQYDSEDDCNKMYKYPLIPPLFFIIINMLKSPLPDKLLIKIDTARRAHKSGRPVLEHLTDDKELSEVLATNLARFYRQRYNHHLTQLHYIGTCIKLYQEKNNTNTEVRRILRITRKQFYSALATSKVIKDRDIILYLEDVSPADFDKLSSHDLLYIRNGA